MELAASKPASDGAHGPAAANRAGSEAGAGAGAADRKLGVQLGGAGRARTRGMVLPFQPLALTFQNVNYYVDMPKVPLVLVRFKSYDFRLHCVRVQVCELLCVPGHVMFAATIRNRVDAVLHVRFRPHMAHL